MIYLCSCSKPLDVKAAKHINGKYWTLVLQCSSCKRVYEHMTELETAGIKEEK